jgi:ferredoxin
MADEIGLLSSDVQIDGEIPVIKDFKMPVITPLVFGPRRLHAFMRRHLVQRPFCDKALCKLCGECWKYCPASAITVKNKKIVFDYNACIRCYCCVEVCPHGALRAVETLSGRMTRKILRRHDR